MCDLKLIVLNLACWPVWIAIANCKTPKGIFPTNVTK